MTYRDQHNSLNLAAIVARMEVASSRCSLPANGTHIFDVRVRIHLPAESVATVASDVTLELDPGLNVAIEDCMNGLSVSDDGSLRLPDIIAGDHFDVVLRASILETETVALFTEGDAKILRCQLRYLPDEPGAKGHQFLNAELSLPFTPVGR